MKPLFVGAYAASPAHAHWDPLFEGQLLDGLVELAGATGIELPWIDGIHPHDPAWLLTHLPATLAVAITPLPWVMARSADPRYGVASDDRDGRAAALADLARVRDDASRLADARGNRIELVMLHTAPRHGRGERSALQRSLETLSGWDWSGARLVVEHCDAASELHVAEKGFLRLDLEIDAIADTPDAGIWMNWGRSAVELRDADAVARQIEAAASSGRLVGLGFSGAADAPGPYGAAWADAHLPLADADDPTRAESLLGPRRVAEALRAAGPAPLLGLKVSRRPQDRTVAEVLETLSANIGRLRDAGA